MRTLLAQWQLRRWELFRRLCKALAGVCESAGNGNVRRKRTRIGAQPMPAHRSVSNPAWPPNFWLKFSFTCTLSFRSEWCCISRRALLGLMIHGRRLLFLLCERRRPLRAEVRGLALTVPSPQHCECFSGVTKGLMTRFFSLLSIPAFAAAHSPGQPSILPTHIHLRHSHPLSFFFVHFSIAPRPVFLIFSFSNLLESAIVGLNDACCT